MADDPNLAETMTLGQLRAKLDELAQTELSDGARVLFTWEGIYRPVTDRVFLVEDGDLVLDADT